MRAAISKALLALVALCGITLAQAPNRGPRMVHTVEKSKIHVPAQSSTGLAIIFNNLGPSTDAYNDTAGEFLAGPLSAAGFSSFYGLPFTPRVNAHIRQVRAAILSFSSTADQINLNIYSDANGVPGTLIAGPVTVTNLPLFGTCCTLATADLGSPLAVTAGTQYWIVADTPTSGLGADFEGEWDFIYPTPFPQAFNSAGGGWVAFNGGDIDPAAAVLGTIP